MRCREIMKTNVECVSPDAPVEQAARRMKEENIGFLPVCDDAKKALGTVTDRDLALRVVAASKSASTPVKEVMTTQVVACKPGDDIRKAEEAMSEHHKSRIVCCDDDGRIVGIISLSDIARHESARRALDTLRQVSEREVRV